MMIVSYQQLDLKKKKTEFPYFKNFSLKLNLIDNNKSDRVEHRATSTNRIIDFYSSY